MVCKETLPNSQHTCALWKEHLYVMVLAQEVPKNHMTLQAVSYTGCRFKRSDIMSYNDTLMLSASSKSTFCYDITCWIQNICEDAIRKSSSEEYNAPSNGFYSVESGSRLLHHLRGQHHLLSALSAGKDRCILDTARNIHCGASCHLLGFDDEDLGSSPGWRAATVATYCLESDQKAFFPFRPKPHYGKLDNACDLRPKPKLHHKTKRGRNTAISAVRRPLTAIWAVRRPLTASYGHFPSYGTHCNQASVAVRVSAAGRNGGRNGGHKALRSLSTTAQAGWGNSPNSYPRNLANDGTPNSVDRLHQTRAKL